MSFRIYLQKGRSRPVGSISPDGKSKKVSDGNWVHVGGADKSVNGKPGMVTVSGRKLYAESTDTDDSFPPAIASYKEVDGWLTYKGRNGSEGVVVGTRADLSKWKKQVDYNVKENSLVKLEGWQAEKHGGAQNIMFATEAANKVAHAFGLPEPRIVFEVSDKDIDASGEYSHKFLRVADAHTNKRREYTGVFEGLQTHAGAHTAAHEMAHGAYSSDPEAGRVAMEAVEAHAKEHGAVTMYHAMTNHHEGLMEAAGLYVLNAREMRKRAPKLTDAVKKWFASSKLAKDTKQ